MPGARDCNLASLVDAAVRLQAVRAVCGVVFMDSRAPISLWKLESRDQKCQYAQLLFVILATVC